jgi:penicillin-binding protein 1A
MSVLGALARRRRTPVAHVRRARAPRLRRALRRLGIGAALAAVSVPLAVGVAWPATPGVGDAETRLRARLAQFGATELTALPSTDRVGSAIIATEDSRFREHLGVDPIGVARAAFNPFFSISAGDPGGATLEQQLAKVLWVPSTGLLGKAEQMELAVKLDRSYSKDQVLRLYLASVYFGHGYYGLPAAARGYFGLAPDALSWGQAALLAGLVQAPSAYDPTVHLALARARQQHVLDRLVATGVLTKPQADVAFAGSLHLR